MVYIIVGWTMEEVHVFSQWSCIQYSTLSVYVVLVMYHNHVQVAYMLKKWTDSLVFFHGMCLKWVSGILVSVNYTIQFNSVYWPIVHGWINNMHNK